MSELRTPVFVGRYTNNSFSSSGPVGSCIRMSTFFRNDAFTDNTCTRSNQPFFLMQRLTSHLIGASVVLMGWSVVEPGMYLIAACLLALNPIFGKISLKELRTRLRNTGVSLASRKSRSDDSQGLRHKAQRPGNSSSGFTELQNRRDRRSASEEAVLALSATNTDQSLHRIDVEQGLVPPTQDRKPAVCVHLETHFTHITERADWIR